MKLQHLILLLLALICLSQAAILIKWAEAPLPLIGMWRMWFACFLLLPLVYKKKGFQQLFSIRGATLRALLLSGLFLFLHFWAFLYAAQNTQISHCMIIFAINPLFTAAGAYLFYGEKISARLAISYILATFGIWLLVSHSLNFDRASVKGDVVAVVAALLFACYFLASFGARKVLDNSAFSLGTYAIVAILFTGSALPQETWFHYPAKTWVAIGMLALFTTLLGHALFTYLMKFINVNVLSCGKLAEPALASGSALLLFNETPTGTTWLAYIAMTLSLAILFVPFRRAN